MWAATAEPHPVDRDRIDGMPAPVRAYLTKALGSRRQAIRTVRFRHGGVFRPTLDGTWQSIRGEQYEAADPPGFVWRGRMRMAPGVWTDVRDRTVNGIGGMLVSLESSMTLFDRTGPEIDQGSLLRLVSDFVLFPTVLLDGRYVTWSALDEHRARVALRVRECAVNGVFEFGDDSLPRGFSAERYFDNGKAPPRLLPWSGDIADYRVIDGMLIPHHFVGYWHVGGTRIPYVDFWLERPQFDVTSPF